MLRLLYKIIDKRGCIAGYTFASHENKEVYISLPDIAKNINNIQGGYLRNGYLLISGVKASEIPTKSLNDLNKKAVHINKNIVGYLKWEDQEVGIIYDNTNVLFINPSLNAVVQVITQNKPSWTRNEYMDFLSDRVISKSRRDIEKILFRLGLIDYDIIKIAELTCALNPKDLFWVAPNKEMKFKEAIKGTFTNIFKNSINEKGSTIYSPDGQNIKSYAISNGKYGINKKRLSNLMTDAESEVAVCKLGELFGVAVCPAWFVDKDTIFSQFVYDFSKEYLVHARRYFTAGERTGDLYKDLITKFPKFKKTIEQMCLIDFITRQDDRHLSNIAITTKGSQERMYPLYDNGRSLFFDEPKEIVEQAVKDIIGYSTTFGEIGTYYDVVEEIAKEENIGSLINLNVSDFELKQALMDSGLKDYRLEGNFKWITGALEILRKLSR